MELQEVFFTQYQYDELIMLFQQAIEIGGYILVGIGFYSGIVISFNVIKLWWSNV